MASTIFSPPPRAQPAPAADYHIKTAGEIVLAKQQDEQKKDEAEAANHPELVLWKNIKMQLTGADGASVLQLRA